MKIHVGNRKEDFVFVSLLKNCAKNKDLCKGISVHDEIVKKGLLAKSSYIASTLIHMYVKCDDLARAQQILDELPVRDVVSWSALIAGYVQQRKAREALNCFEQMRHEGITPNVVIFTCILKAYAITGTIEKGKQIHDEVINRGLLVEDIVLGNALVNMYVKCGNITKAQKLLQELPERDVVSWNIIIAGYAQQGQAHDALNCFKHMRGEGIFPNSVTFVCILNACSHSGLSDDAEMFFGSMSRDYGIIPNLEHYTCMVVLCGCAGHFEKALSMIKTMPSSVYPSAWLSLLGACKKWGNVEIGREAFECAVKLNAKHDAAYLLMFQIYEDAHMFEDAKKIEAMRMKFVGKCLHDFDFL